MIGIFTERFDTDDPAADLVMGGIGDLVRSGPAIIKVHYSKTQLRYARGKDKHILYVYRNIPELEEPFGGNIPSAAFADVYWATIKPRLSDVKFAVINVWPNEPSVDTESLKQLDDFYARLAVIARVDGYTIAGYGLSAEGAAALADGRWQYLKKSLKALKDNGHYADFHGYFSPSLKDPAGQHFLFPWRRLRQIIPADIMPPVICGEFGIDTNLGMGRLFDGYRTVPGYGNKTYAEELLWADGELRKDNVPACIYLATRANCPEDQIQYNILIDDSRRNNPNPSVWERIRGSISDTWAGGPIEIPIPPVDPQPPTAPQPGRYVTTAEVNIRLTPDRSKPEIGSIKAAKPVTAESFVTGEVYQGNPYWAKLGDGMHLSAYFLKKA